MGNKNDNQTSPQNTPPVTPAPATAPVTQPVVAAPVTPTKAPAPVQKVGSKLSMGTFLIGCVVFLVLLVGLAAIVMYMIIKNPDQYASIGLDRGTVQKLLQTFTILFFGFLFFVGLGLLVVNAYRLVTVKNRPKFGYMTGTIIWFFVLLGSIALWAVTISNINQMAASQNIDTNSLLVPYVNFKDGPQYFLGDPSIKLIAPISLSYQLNSPVFNAQVYPTLGVVDIEGVTLDCGNGQIVNMDTTNLTFTESCFYPTQGDYPHSIAITHVNRQTKERKTDTISVGVLNVPAEISIDVEDGEVRYENGEVVVGKVPRKVTFDASAIFGEFNLRDYLLSRDTNGDGENDRENDPIYTFVYNYAQLYSIDVRFPGLNWYLYTFPLRVEPSDVPVCLVASKALKGTQYELSTTFLDRAKIDEYGFSIIDIADDKVIERIKSTTDLLNYTFPRPGSYAVKVDFVTDEGKQGYCESDDFDVGSSDFDINYDIYYKSPQAPTYAKAGAGSGDVVSLANDIITIQQIPTIIQLRITKISPNNPNATTRVFFNDSAIVALEPGIYEVKFDSETSKDISVTIEDAERGAKTEKIISVVSAVSQIEPKLLITPDVVGSDPFTVTFDASSTVLRDTNDQIIYFTWNFGDGEIKKNLSQAIVSHTYKYDSTTENGTYTPVVTIQTKKGHSLTFSGELISVMRPVPNISIDFDSHPSQVAKVGDKVDLILKAEWLPKKIYRNFGNGKTLECAGRQCISASTSYDETGNYPITVKVEYDSKPTAEATQNIKIQ
jgi:hypothetical protein